MVQNSRLIKELISASHFSKSLSVICMIIVHSFSYSCSFSDHINSCINETLLIGFLMGMTSNFLITSGLSLALKQFNIDQKNTTDLFTQVITFSSFLIVLDFFSQLFLGLGAEGLKYGSSILTIGISSIVIIVLTKINFYLIPLLGILCGLFGQYFKENIFSITQIFSSNNDTNFYLLGAFQILSYLFIINICLFLIVRKIKPIISSGYFCIQLALLALMTFPNLDPNNFKFFFIKLLWGSPNDNILFPLLFWFPRVSLGWCLFFLIKRLFEAKASTQKIFLFILTIVYFAFPYFSGRMDIKLFDSRSINLWDSEFNSNINIRIVALSILFNILVLLAGKYLSALSPYLENKFQKISSISLYLYIFIGSNIHRIIFSVFKIDTFYMRVLSLLIFYLFLSILLIRLVDLYSHKVIKLKLQKI